MPEWPFLFIFRILSEKEACCTLPISRIRPNLSPMTDLELSKLLEENLKLNKEIHGMVKKTALYIKWLRVMDILKLLLILIPLIAAWIYLPQLIQSISGGYSDIYPSLLR